MCLYQLNVLFRSARQQIFGVNDFSYYVSRHWSLQYSLMLQNTVEISLQSITPDQISIKNHKIVTKFFGNFFTNMLGSSPESELTCSGLLHTYLVLCEDTGTIKNIVFTWAPHNLSSFCQMYGFIVQCKLLLHEYPHHTQAESLYHDDVL